MYILNAFHKITNLIKLYYRRPYFGFINGHAYLSDEEVLELHSFLGSKNDKVVESFEESFSGLIGNGKSVSFASGRMGFYVLMQVLGVKAGDEVVLQGATCSVMANAILRIGATPIYADIDPETYGSSAKYIAKVITSKTKVVVAQHSFGIPCDIEPVLELTKSRNIFLLEDCALTVGSKLNGVVCGNFGGAALFSTDHSKPLNTITGGLVYTKDYDLFKSLKEIQKNSQPLSIHKQKALWKQFLFERKYCRPGKYGKIKLISAIRSRIGFYKRPFLDDDFGSVPSRGYPYPAKLPTFLAKLGMFELQQWEHTVQFRKYILKQLLNIITNPENESLFSVYHNSATDIVPLRLVWSEENGEILRNELANCFDTSGTWFLQPVVATGEPLENFGYHAGTCKISECVGKNMINLPCNFNPEWMESVKYNLVKFFAKKRNVSVI